MKKMNLVVALVLVLGLNVAHADMTFESAPSHGDSILGALKHWEIKQVQGGTEVRVGIESGDDEATVLFTGVDAATGAAFASANVGRKVSASRDAATGGTLNLVVLDSYNSGCR